MLLGIPRSARCVQRFDDSLNSAIHITYRISLRSSSMREPRDPLLKVVTFMGGTSPQDILRRVCETAASGGLAPHPPPRKVHSGFVVVEGRGPAARQFAGARPPSHPEEDTLMILPQVHLRKPCYDFYFLSMTKFDQLLKPAVRLPAPQAQSG